MPSESTRTLLVQIALASSFSYSFPFHVLAAHDTVNCSRRGSVSITTGGFNRGR